MTRYFGGDSKAKLPGVRGKLTVPKQAETLSEFFKISDFDAQRLKNEDIIDRFKLLSEQKKTPILFFDHHYLCRGYINEGSEIESFNTCPMNIQITQNLKVMKHEVQASKYRIYYSLPV